MPEPTPDQWQTIQASLAAGQMIQAIKLYREATGVGLAEAKDGMEAYREKLHAEDPDRFPVQAKAGCAGVIVLFAVGCAAIARLLA